MEFYEVKRDNYERWKVWHKGSGLSITDTTYLDSFSKAEAIQWATRAEEEAGTHDKWEAYNKLVASNFLRDWKAKVAKERNERYDKLVARNFK